MQERAVKAHTLIDHPQIAFEREGMVGREDDDAVGGRDHARAGRHRDAGARLVRSLFTAPVDALRPAIGRDSPTCRTVQPLAPSLPTLLSRPPGLASRPP